MLKKLAPETITLCPTDPLAGLSEEITGGPAGATATVVVVDDVGVEVVGVVAGAGSFRGPVKGEWVGAVGACPDGAAAGDGGAVLLLDETINAMAAATTRTATTATVPINQRSGRPGGAVSPAGPGGCRSSRGGGGGERRGACRFTGAANSTLHRPQGALTRRSRGRLGRTLVWHRILCRVPFPEARLPFTA